MYLKLNEKNYYFECPNFRFLAKTSKKIQLKKNKKTKLKYKIYIKISNILLVVMQIFLYLAVYPSGCLVCVYFVRTYARTN